MYVYNTYIYTFIYIYYILSMTTPFFRYLYSHFL
uniref:Uncharacterized protein n=1 Tax=Anguilla anguilla TaxID=7936 RepID=A0A0E9UXS4_ANGAN